MDFTHDILRVLHVVSFVFMSVPLFNLIVVNERAIIGGGLTYGTDRYMENIIRRGATRCYVFQSTAFATGVGLLLVGPLGLSSLWASWVILAKWIILLALMALLSFVHLRLQPRIETLISVLDPNTPVSADLGPQLKPLRVLRKRLATICLFLVLSAIILGMQVYGTFSPTLNALLFASAALFAWRANRTVVRFGWL
jgi:hypothetical protein